jgi:hypothetical protein
LLGKLLYNFYYKPRGVLKDIAKSGPLNYIATHFARLSMIRHSIHLKEISYPDNPQFVVYFLTGKKYWYQTSFCLYSLQKASKDVTINAAFIDDGTISENLKRKIKSQFPSSTLISKAKTEAILDEKLPKDRYPTIRAKRLKYPHLKKLTDIHIHSDGWKLVLDSDMLFYDYPDTLIDWLKQPQIPIFIRDPLMSYHYSLKLMQRITGHDITPFINVGVAGLKSENINWDQVELWIKELEDLEGTSYLLEQAITAMLVAGKAIYIADDKNYIVMPTKKETDNTIAVMHHYVAQSKEYYYKKAWKTIV